MKRPMNVNGIFLSAVLLSTVGCAQSGAGFKQGLQQDNETAGIVNGSVAKASDVAKGGVAESVVIILAQSPDGKGQALCTGTLIGPDTVLTAGHCFPDGSGPADVVVATDVLSMYRNPAAPTVSEGVKPTGYKVAAFKIHPDFVSSQSSKNDLAIIRLASSVPATRRIASLPQEGADLSALEGLIAVGYGVADERHNATQETKGSGTLRTLAIPVSKLAEIPERATIDPSVQGMIATDGRLSSLCHGDSGGPLFGVVAGESTNVVYGVSDRVNPAYEGQQQIDYKNVRSLADLNSFYEKYPEANICSGGPNLSVNVSKNLTWIKETAAALAQ